MNQLICGDNLKEIQKLPENSIDLIYIDPPFFSNKKYEVIYGNDVEVRSFEDRWKGGIEHYISWLKPRVQSMYEVLKPTGSFYLHCDYHANAYIRIMLDEIFETKNFQNEIIWSYDFGGRSKKIWPRKHDTIFFYTKSKKWNFNFGFDRIPYKGNMHKGQGYNKEKAKGKAPTDVWDIPLINTMAKERIGYPTQKPEPLLKRIIQASSNKGDIIADFFCGSGTTLQVAQQLNRRWIGIDISSIAIKLSKKRLNETWKQ